MAELRLVPSDAPLDLLLDALNSGAPEVVLSGYAGAGKTTLLNALLATTTGGAAGDARIIDIAFAAPTYKAARRLTEVTGRPATTVHALIYGAAHEEWVKPDGSVCRGFVTQVPQLDGSVLEQRTKPPGCPGCMCRSDLRFGAPKGMATAQLVVIDEASMIGLKLAKDIREAVARYTNGAQILWVGDPAQLPPVGDEPGVDLHDPDVMLTKVWRADGGILQIATDIRSAGSFEEIAAILQRGRLGAYSDVSVHSGGVPAVAEWRANTPSRMAITHTNKDRQAVNARVREILAPARAKRGRVGVLCTGDRLLARQMGKNGDRVVIIKSTLYTLTDVQPLDKYFAVRAQLDGDPDQTEHTVIVRADYMTEQGEARNYLAEHQDDPFGRQARNMRDTLRKHTDRCGPCRGAAESACGECGEPARRLSDGLRVWCEVCAGPRDALSITPGPCTCGPLAGVPLVNFHYGYAITAHAAQGSEAEDVGVYWTPWTHRRDFETGRSWLYTAVTRARSTLRIWA